ncbi:MAG: type II toxin-antitoxin system VapC family toxin [Acidimicrobiales bacterium]|nr:MAG: type II toxin-antitoxin system VapC family toxin [Acidimicrobiales bacterium]
MKLLLDTHVFVWASTDDPQLGGMARELITDPANPLLVSAASAWEMSIKAASGKWPAADTMIDGIHDAIHALGASTLPIEIEHAVRAGRLDWAHRDPFDRMLAAQAICEGATLVTADRAFEASGARLIRPA